MTEPVSEEAVGETKWRSVVQPADLDGHEYFWHLAKGAETLVGGTAAAYLSALEEELKQLRAGLQDSNGMWRLSADRAHVQSLGMDKWADEPPTSLVKALREYHADRDKAWKENKQLRAARERLVVALGQVFGKLALSDLPPSQGYSECIAIIRGALKPQEQS